MHMHARLTRAAALQKKKNIEIKAEPRELQLAAVQQELEQRNNYLKNLFEGKEGSSQLPSSRVVEFFCMEREEEERMEKSADVVFLLL